VEGAAVRPSGAGAPEGYVVSFIAFHERGLGMPPSRFMRALLHHYKVELHHLAPNSISQVAIFAAVCEGYLGMEPHWNLWLHLFKAEHFAKKAGERGVRRAVHVGSCTLQVRVGQGELYIPAQLISSNNGWHDGWFYLRNDDDRLLKFSGRVLMSHEDNWTYGVIKEEKPKLQSLLDTLRRLRQRGLTAGMVAAVLHRRRVLPLMQHRLRIDEMTPGVLLEGSRMSHETLPLDEVARRARWMVGSFKQEDVDKVPMRPNQGFEPLVSVVPLALCPFASRFS
jgi:hypothetical protein